MSTETLSLTRSPHALWVLLFLELWECFLRFGVNATFIFYAQHQFHLSLAFSYALLGQFMGLYYLMPVLSGWLIDLHLGMQRSLVLGSVAMVLGSLTMGVGNLHMLYLGMALAVVGNGFFLPALAPLLSQLYDASTQRRGFTWYWLGKNLGALLAPVCFGALGQWYSYRYAFILTAMGLGGALWYFSRYRDRYWPDSRPVNSDVLCASVVGLCILGLWGSFYVPHLLGPLLPLGIFIGLLIFAFQAVPNTRWSLVLLLGVVWCFMSALNQGGMSLNNFIHAHVQRQVMGVALPAAFFYALNPLFMMLIGGIYLKYSQKQQHVNRSFAGAFLCLAIGFGIFAIAAQGNHAPVSPWFVIAAYAIFPMAELTLMPTSLSCVTLLAPDSSKARYVGAWMLANALAQLSASEVAQWQLHVGFGSFFSGVAGVLGVVAVLVFFFFRCLG